MTMDTLLLGIVTMALVPLRMIIIIDTSISRITVHGKGMEEGDPQTEEHP